MFFWGSHTRIAATGPIARARAKINIHSLHCKSGHRQYTSPVWINIKLGIMGEAKMRLQWTMLVTLLVGMTAALAQAAEYQPNEVIVKYKNGGLRSRIETEAFNSIYKVKKVKRS